MGRSVSYLSNAQVAFIAYGEMYAGEVDCWYCEGTKTEDCADDYIGPSLKCDQCEGKGTEWRDSDEHDWECFTEDLLNVIQASFPSMYEGDRWLDREVKQIAMNQLVEVGISEYCGLVSVSLRPKEFEEYYAEDARLARLANIWMRRSGEKFLQTIQKAYGDKCLRKMGTFSNGEGVYERCLTS